MNVNTLWEKLSEKIGESFQDRELSREAYRRLHPELFQGREVEVRLFCRFGYFSAVQHFENPSRSITRTSKRGPRRNSPRRRLHELLLRHEPGAEITIVRVESS